MAEGVAQQMAKLQLEVQSLQAQLQMRPSVTKDLSLVSLVPKWTGNVKANIKMDLQEVRGGCGDWTELAEDRDRSWALVSAVMNFQIP
jgi:hypothetical protein